MTGGTLTFPAHRRSLSLLCAHVSARRVTFLLETTPSSSRVPARPRTAHVTPHGRGPGPSRRRVPSASASARLRRPRGPAGRLVGGPVVKRRGAPRRMRRGVPVPGVFRERGSLAAGFARCGARSQARRPQTPSRPRARRRWPAAPWGRR